MPITLPTADEIARMPWSARPIVRSNVMAALRSLLDMIDEPAPVRTPGELERLAFDAAAERAAAALALALLPPDPAAADHRAELLAAIA